MRCLITILHMGTSKQNERLFVQLTDVYINEMKISHYSEIRSYVACPAILTGGRGNGRRRKKEDAGVRSTPGEEERKGIEEARCLQEYGIERERDETPRINRTRNSLPEPGRVFPSITTDGLGRWRYSVEGLCLCARARQQF